MIGQLIEIVICCSLGWSTRHRPVWTKCAKNASNWEQQCFARRDWVSRIYL